MITVDFHCHCAPYSECARQSVDELIQRAKEAGITCLAITNHDTITDLNLFKSKCSKASLSFIQGAEFGAHIGTSLEGFPSFAKVHILGLYLDNDSSLVEDCFSKYKEENDRIKKERNTYLENKYGIVIPPHSSKKAIRDLLVANKSAFTDKEAKGILNSKEFLDRFHLNGPSIERIITLIHSLNGIAVLAHPFQGEYHYDYTDDQVERILKYCRKHGLDGIEVIHPDTCKKSKTIYLYEYAKKHTMCFTLGSDRHFKEDNREGHYFIFDEDPYREIVEEIKQNDYWRSK